jgi:hypothetical protein
VTGTKHEVFPLPNAYINGFGIICRAVEIKQSTQCASFEI